MKHRHTTVLALVSLLAACATRGALPTSYVPQTISPAGSAVWLRATASAESYASVPSPVPSADAPGARGGAPSGPAAEARPGLATEWGESRSSALSYQPFVRASASPFDLAALRYNDARLGEMQALAHAATPVAWRGLHRDGVRLSLRDERGAALPGYHAGDAVFVLGESGQRYSILLENLTADRFEAVVSVDGLDVINGRPAALGHRGYILPPHGRLEVEGFRRSEAEVASFRFGRVADSYAAQTGDARNVGVIGVALFAERGAWSDGEEVELRARANPFPSGFAAPPPATRFR